MSDHLPECPQRLDGFRERCICHLLKAVEWRLEDEWLGKYNAAEQRGYDAGFRNGVQASRDAVAALSSLPYTAGYDDPDVPIITAIAAIDALRGDR